VGEHPLPTPRRHAVPLGWLRQQVEDGSREAVGTIGTITPPPLLRMISSSSGMPSLPIAGTPRPSDSSTLVGDTTLNSNDGG